MNEPSINVRQLSAAWVHSHEEDTPTATVYRPAEFPFPPARGRKGFRLWPDGTLVSERPGPTDRTETAPGAWSLRGNLLQLVPVGGAAQTLCVESVDADRLVIRKPPQ